MRSSKVILLVTCLFVLAAFIAYRGVKAEMTPAARGESTPAATGTEHHLEKMLRKFLDGAGKNDPEAHERFWADDVIYTGATGKVKTKADIMKIVRETAAKKPDPHASKASFDPQDITVHEYGDYAVMNFELVVHVDGQGNKQTCDFRNTATFGKRDDDWKVVAWQASKIEDKPCPISGLDP